MRTSALSAIPAPRGPISVMWSKFAHQVDVAGLFLNLLREGSGSVLFK
jgi:hypothetical protein